MATELGTLGQWAAPFITFGLSFLRREPAKRKQSEVDGQVAELIRHLGAKRVFLLKRLERRDGSPDSPERFGADLAAFDGSKDGPGWADAARYACAFLSLLNLIEYRGGDVVISPLGRAVLNSSTVRAEFAAALSRAQTL